MEFSNTITIKRPVPEVFAFVENFENVPKWNYAIIETRKTSEGPVGVGSTYEQTRSLPNESTETFEVVEYITNEKLAIRGDVGPLHGVLTYEFRPVGDGTELTNSATLEASGLQRVVARLGESRVREAVGANLGKLKEILES